MYGSTPKNENKNLIDDSLNQQVLLLKFNSSKIKRNSSIVNLEKFQNEYMEKHPELNNKIQKCDTPKNSRKMKKVSNIKSPKKNKRASVVYNSGNIKKFHNYLEKLYQSEKHMKKNILKKKKDDSNKKPNLRVSFMNLTQKNDNFKFNKKKLNFSNYIKNENNSFKNSETKNKNDDIIEEEDGQAYGFNKTYKIKMFDEINKDKRSLNKEDFTPKILQTSLFKRNRGIDFESEKENTQTHKTFISPKFNDSDMDKLRDSHLKLKLKNTQGNTNFKKLKKKLTKSLNEQDKKSNNNVVNINYNINLNNQNNLKHKNHSLKKKETNKSQKKFKSNDNINRAEILSQNKIRESTITNKILNNNNNDKENKSKSEKTNNKIYKYVQNCCFPFLTCLNGNNG